METTFSVDGLDELEAKLLAIERGTAQDFLLGALKDATKPVQDDMKRRVAAQFTKRTGKLLRIRRVARKYKGNRKALHSAQVAIGPSRKARYSIHLEYGTSHIKAQPFMRPALEENVGTVLTIFKRRLRLRLEQYQNNE